MKKLTWISILMVLFSCKKDNDPRDLRLLRMESTYYNGDIVNTEYHYDHMGRITSITSKKNSEQPVELVSVAYTGSEVLLVSLPDYDPAVSIRNEVRLTLDASGKVQKRIGYSRYTSKIPGPNAYQEFRYDTSIHEYDAAGLLKNTIRVRRDSIAGQGYTTKKKFDFTVNYTNSGGNVVARDEYVTYPYTTTQGGVTTISGGRSEYHNVNQYAQSFPNKTDFKNAAVLAEYPLFYYDPPLNSNYKSMPEQIAVHNLDWDINGNKIFDLKGTINVARGYDSRGFLSAITIPGNTQATKITFFYGRK